MELDIWYTEIKTKKAIFCNGPLTLWVLFMEMGRLWAWACIDKPSAAVGHTDRKSLSHDWDIGTLSNCTEGFLCIAASTNNRLSHSYTHIQTQRTQEDENKAGQEEIFRVLRLRYFYENIWNQQLDFYLTCALWNTSQFLFLFSSYLPHHIHTQFP